MLRNASAVNLSESGGLTGQNFLNNYICVTYWWLMRDGSTSANKYMKVKKIQTKYSKQLHLCNRLIANERRQYIRKQIHESEKNPNKLWANVNNILHRKAMPSMPNSTDLPSLCASFSTFFIDKIEKNRLKFCTVNRKPEFIPPLEIKCHLTCFEPATSEEVSQ